MNNEIKEIIDELKECNDNSISPVLLQADEISKLLDYITNLQKGYCELKVKCNNGECDCTNEEYECMVQTNIKGSLLLEDYKSRNEKAIEYIMTELITEWDIENDGCVIGSDLPVDAITPLLNILQGEDKDE